MSFRQPRCGWPRRQLCLLAAGRTGGQNPDRRHSREREQVNVAGEIKTGRVPLAATGPILLTGASGYVGGRLLSALEHDGHRVRCLARRPEMLPTRADSATQVVAGDVLDRTSLDAALEGIETAYYLVHS